MKIRALLALILILTTLAGCQSAGPGDGAPSLPAAATTAAPASAPTSPPAAPTDAPSATPPPTDAPTETPAPSETPLPPSPTVEPSATPEPATATPELTAEAPANETVAPAAGAPAAGALPVEGLWNGVGTSLALSFQIRHENGQAVIYDVSVLWLGPGVCTVDLLSASPTVIDPARITRAYEVDDMRFSLTGQTLAPDLITGDVAVRQEDCASREIHWIAKPKAAENATPAAAASLLREAWRLEN